MFQPRKLKCLQGKFLRTRLWFRTGVTVDFWHPICKNNVVHKRTAIIIELYFSRQTYDWSNDSNFFLSRQSWTTSFPSNMKMMCGFVLATGHHFSRTTINLIYIMYDKPHGLHYRIQDIQRVLWRHFKPIFFWQIQYTWFCFNKKNELPASSHTEVYFYKLVACFMFLECGVRFLEGCGGQWGRRNGGGIMEMSCN